MQALEALEKLKLGNKRFVENKVIYPKIFSKDKVNIHKPCAVIVSCADARVSPEMIFDQDIGELFIIRVAGNVVGPLEMESIQFAVKCLDVSLILVMGHENCGAVTAALEGKDDLKHTFKLLEPAIKNIKSKNGLKQAIKLNAESMCSYIKKFKFIDESKHEVIVKPAYFNFHSKEVEIF